MSEQDKVFTPEDLHQYDGQDGRPTYIAYKGVVYDVTGSKMWRNGKHMNRHTAAHDLSLEFGGAPHKPDVLERYPRVGTLKQTAEAEAKGAKVPELPAIVKKYPFLHRHPHPMTVHFPIVFSISVTSFMVLYLLSGWKGFEYTVLCTLFAGVLFTPVAIATGFFTWWLNYGSRIMKETLMKILLSPLLFALMLWALVIRLQTPDILDRSFGESWLYILLTLCLFPLASLVGWFGANLTFPIHKEE